MKVLMLGWEYPPHITGGLGTACEGLTKALAQTGASIQFIVPHLFGDESAHHMKLQDLKWVNEVSHLSAKEVLNTSDQKWDEILNRIEILKMPSYLQPYLTNLQHLTEDQRQWVRSEFFKQTENWTFWKEWFQYAENPSPHGAKFYEGDLFYEVYRYAHQVQKIVNHTDAEIIHAHDWMTFPAAVALKMQTGLPLVVHVHSLEYDRTGGGGHPHIYYIEKMGLEAANKVIAVSYYTKQLIHKIHGIPLEKIGVVHNGVYSDQEFIRQKFEMESDELDSRPIVLFLGRITLQKGPDYFVEAAAKVVPFVPDVLFVMAGSGDMLPRMMERVSQLGISKNFLFTGFLKGKDVEKMYSLANLYVMPSVSEPFGIAPLEAVSFETPVLISKQSGVSEVLRHSLKVDFWDIDELANQILAIIKYPELSMDIVGQAREEVRRLHWESAAEKTYKIYHETKEGRKL